MGLTKEQAEEIYTILAEECGAPDEHLDFERHTFVRYMSGGAFAKEFRFQGQLGFGGKCYQNQNRGGMPYASYYPENHSKARDEMVSRANERIAALFAAEVPNA